MCTEEVLQLSAMITRRCAYSTGYLQLQRSYFLFITGYHSSVSEWGRAPVVQTPLAGARYSTREWKTSVGIQWNTSVPLNAHCPLLYSVHTVQQRTPSYCTLGTPTYNRWPIISTPPLCGPFTTTPNQSAEEDSIRRRLRKAFQSSFRT